VETKPKPLEQVVVHISVRVFCNVDHHVMHTFHSAHTLTSHVNSMDHDARIQEAIADLESQERVNYGATAKKRNLDRTTLARRYRGETGSNQEANSYARQQLTDVQENILIEYINKLSNQGLPPTP
jgi:flagellar biosynthesis GTPase FlhF